jgi:hypothetical protein
VVLPSFEGSAPVGYETLVRELKLSSPLAACSLLCTAKRMFSRNLRAVAEEYTEPGAGADSEIEELRRILADGGAQSGGALRSKGQKG